MVEKLNTFIDDLITESELKEITVEYTKNEEKIKLSERLKVLRRIKTYLNSLDEEVRDGKKK